MLDAALARKPDDLRSRMTSGRDARRKPPRGTATPPLHLRRGAGGPRAAAPGTGPRQPPAVTFGLAELRRGGAILPSATILKPGKITGEGAARHTYDLWSPSPLILPGQSWRLSR